MILSSHRSILDGVDICALIMAQDAFTLDMGSSLPGLTCTFRRPTHWNGLISLWMILVKSHAKIPQKVCQLAGFGPSGPNSVRFGSTLDMLFLKSNKHQNLWNSSVIMVLAWLWLSFHEIRRSVGGENHRYRPPTHPHSQTLLAPSNKVEKERSLVS